MKKKIGFVFYHEYEEMWKDGLYAALLELSKKYNIEMFNLNSTTPKVTDLTGCDFVLAWGAFGSKPDIFLRETLGNSTRQGLCIAGNAVAPYDTRFYDVLFYETDWYKPQIETHPHIIKAFGVNSKIFKPIRRKKVWDWITVGAFALWKRQELITRRWGLKLAVGEIQKGNPRESLMIVSKLLASGVMISDMVSPETLADLYNMSEAFYMPADIYGGGERTVLEARSCGIPVHIEPDNPKLQEILDGPILNELDYAKQLEKGIEACL